MLEMNQELATPQDMKVAVSVPTAGVHALGSGLSSKDVEAVYAEIEKFALEKLRLQKIN